MYLTDDCLIMRMASSHVLRMRGQVWLSLIDLCCSYDLHVSNGILFDDENGEFTCFANEGASVVDYMLSSSSVFKFVNFFKVGDCIFSVHCPLVCTPSLCQIY